MTKVFLGIIFFLMIFLFSLFLTEKFTQSFHFVDEEDHLVFAHFMNKGYRLYEDIVSAHQPLVYFLSSVTQKVFQPKTLFLLIKRGREAVFLHSFAWSIFLFSQYGWLFLFSALFFESTKFFLFGNLLLAESLAVYPLLFVLGETFRAVFFSHRQKNWQVLLFGLANFLIIFNLLPLIPGLFLLDVIFLIKTKKFKLFWIGFLVPTFLLFLFIDPLDWYRQTIVYNLKYHLPKIAPTTKTVEMVNFFLFPILLFFRGDFSILPQYIRFFSCLTAISLAIFLTIKKRGKKDLLLLLILLFAVLSLNNRVISPKNIYYYEGFHLLPWYAAFIFLNLLLVKLITREGKRWLRFIPLIILVFVGPFLLLNGQMPFFTKIDKEHEHHVNFFPYYLMGRLIKSVSDANDKLAVFPYESLIYWQSGLKPATRQIVYYEWQYDVPQFRKEIDETFIYNPPEFIYWNFDYVGTGYYAPLLNSILEKSYYQVSSKGKTQNLFIKKEKIKKITEAQWQEWNELGFDKIELEKLNHD